MFVGFTKTLKRMSGFRLGFGIRINKRNCGYWLFAMCFATADQKEGMGAFLEKRTAEFQNR